MQDTLPFSFAVRTLDCILGRRLTAYVAGVRDTRVVDLWIAGIPDDGVEARLRLAHAAAGILAARECPERIREWFMEPEQQLGNRSPALVIREGGERNDVIAAAARSVATAGCE
jgi:hypothetical protein